MNDKPVRRRVRLSPTTVIALLALVFAVSTPAHAAMERIAAGTVGTAQLKDGAVTTPKVRGSAITGSKIAGNAVTGSKVASRSIGLSDLAASATPKPPRALVAPNVSFAELRSTPTVVTSRSLPKGRWTVVAKGIMAVTDSHATCRLTVAGASVDVSTMSSAGFRVDNFASLATFTLTATRSVAMSCVGGPNSGVGEVVLSAVEVR